MRIPGLALCAALATSFGPSLAGAQDAPPASDPAQFAALAASANQFEIDSSQIVLQNGQIDTVRAFAEHMVQDHTAAGEKMKAAAEKDGVTPPAEMAPEMQAKLDQLKSVEAPQVDEVYLTMQVTAHDEAVALFESYASNGTEGALRTFAEETLPTLREHQAAVQALVKVK